MADISLTIVILTYNEEQHIGRAISCFSSLPCRIIVVDSLSKDNTCQLAESKGAEVVKNPFISQAQQFQWAMDNCEIKTDWILRLDADETIDGELCDNIKSFISSDGYGYNGAIFLRKHIFLGKWVKHGGRYPLPMLRLYRRGKAHIEQRWMDEHIVLDEGSSIVLRGDFSDNNLNSVTWFIDKHNKYATREMIDIMLKRLFPDADTKITENSNFSIRFKRFLKQSIYMKLPYFIRPLFYFCFRYFLQLGFLDGARGLAYHFMQAFWYRALVDLKCLEVDKLWDDCSNDEQRLKVLENISGYSLVGVK